jgi:phospholipid/cholesterol/gamma-HCH transport system permease protein
MIAVIEHIGRRTLGISSTLRDTLSFSFRIIRKMFDKKMYNSAMKTLLINQIYFTSVQILPLFLAASILVGSFLIGIVFQILKDLGLAEYTGRILMGFVVTELSPLITVLLITLRSSSAMNAEVAVMKVNYEINTLKVFNIDLISYLFLPRMINGIISVCLLSSLFSIAVLVSGILFSKLIFGMSIDAYTSLILNSATFSDIVILLLKCSSFGFFITLIPIHCGLNATNELTSIPIAVSTGMVKVFIAIIIIEVLSLIIRFI